MQQEQCGIAVSHETIAHSYIQVFVHMLRDGTEVVVTKNATSHRAME